jgi:hypothetical protein
MSKPKKIPGTWNFELERKSGENIERNGLFAKVMDMSIRVMRTLWGMYTAIAESGNT